MTFDHFFALYYTHGLKDRPEFLTRYFSVLPSEAQRELLVPWFRRVSYILDQGGKIVDLQSASFGKLLRVDRFPVTELFSEAELEDNLLLWSLAFLRQSKIRIGDLSEARLNKLLSAIVRSQNLAFWQSFGEPILIELIPQILSDQNFKRERLDSLLTVLETYKAPSFVTSLQSYMKGLDQEKKLMPQWNSLLEFLNRLSRVKGKKSTPSRSTKRVQSSHNKSADNLPF
jgi:hypothetical protein